MMAQRVGMASLSDQPILTGSYWEQTWLGIPFWGWALGAAVLVFFWPVSEAERRTGKPFGIGGRR